MKPTLDVNLDEEGLGALVGGDVLANLAADPIDQVSHRRALALYNRSVVRISDKVERATYRFEELFSEEIPLGFDKLAPKHDAEIVDFLELVLYSAAEHTDDLKQIARELAGPRGENPDRASARLDKLLKSSRDRISLMTNQIKHSQWRINLLRQEFFHGSETTILYGFSLSSPGTDRVKLERLPPDNVCIIALPTLLCMVVEYLFLASQSLCEYLGSASTPPPTKHAKFARAIAAVVRLPAYTFDEAHPTTRVRWRIHAATPNTRALILSKLYGSLARPWSKKAQGSPGGSVCAVTTDGVNRSFDFPTPKKVSLVFWD
jgi:hypothetical protein